MKSEPNTGNSHEKYTAFVCSHTHWDREWYGSFQQFRYRLVRVMDRLMDLLENDPEYRTFNLDGQTICLEDYLEVRPEQRERLQRLIRENRISIGPWYMLPDEWLVSAESTVRNFLEGRTICREFGVEQPRLAYLPDMFGHYAQIPQMVRGFGWDVCIFWRGLAGDEWMTELWWESPDGSKVLGIHLPEYCGYCNAGFFYGSLPKEARNQDPEPDGRTMTCSDTDMTVEALGAIARRAMDKSVTGNLLLMNGVDHMEPQPELSGILKAASQRYSQVEFKHATFEEFTNAVKKSLPDELQTVKGEHRSTVWTADSATIIIQNIFSSRIQLKQMNARCQTLLERWVEPFGVIAHLAGGTYPDGFIRQAWRMLMKNHPHDSIGGCSIDEVHYQMEARFSEVEDLAKVLLQASLQEVVDRIDRSALEPHELACHVFNPLPWTVTDTIRTTVDIDEAWLREQGVVIHPDNIYRSIRALQFRTFDGEPVNTHVHSIELVSVHRPWATGFCPIRQTVRFVMDVAARDLAPLGYTTFRVSVPKKLQRLPNRHSLQNPAVLENEHLRAEFLANGTIALTSKASGSTEFTNLHYFEDGGDNGDGYTFSPPRHDRIVTTLAGKVQLSRVLDEPSGQAVALDYEMEIPEGVESHRQGRSERTVPLKIRSTFRLGADARRLDVETRFVNPAKDHRIQVCFPVLGKAEVHTAESQFHVIERSNLHPQPPEEVWLEDEPLEMATTGYVSYERLAISLEGIPEYEVVQRENGAVIKATLFRAVNYLGAGGHGNTLIGGAGPTMETPMQQALGREFTFRYSIIPHSGNWERDGVPTQAAQHQSEFFAVTAAPGEGELPGAAHSWFALEGAAVNYSALKMAHHSTGDVVVRVWNRSSKKTTATVSIPSAFTGVKLANLAEEVTEDIAVEDGKVAVDLNGAEIVTVRMTR